ncbi:MAG: ComEC family competence protein [Muribaculaceae bacterium]|nr:ComEC family competence protein [Muribaculaceae bacterium]
MPALPAAAGIIVGVLLWTLGLHPAIALLPAVAAVLLFLFRHFYPGAALLAVALGWLAASLHAPTDVPANVFNGRPAECTGRVENVSGSASSVAILIHVESIGNSAVTPFMVEARGLPGGRIPVEGDIIKADLVLSEPDCFHDIPGERNPSLYFLRKGIVATAYIEPDNLKVIGHTDNLSSRMAARREALISRLARSGLDDSTFALLAALLTGYDDELPAATVESFRTSGIAHALALSGFHAGIIVLLVSLALYPLRLWPRLRTLRFFLSIAILWLYAALTGFPLSVVRAVFMMSVYLLSLAAGRASNPPNSLCAAILVIVALSPFSIFSEGLQLSVAAVIGIMVFARPLNFVPPRHRLLYKTAGLLTLPVAALLGTLPVTALYFHTMPLLFPLSNLIISLALPVWMFGGVILLIIGSIGLPTGASAWILDKFTGIVSHIIDWMAILPGGHIDGLSSTPATALLMLAITVAGAVAVHLGNRRTVIAVIGAIFLIPVISALLRPGQSQSEVILARHDFTTSLLLRDGNRVAVVNTATDRGRQGCERRLNRCLEGYTTLRSIDSIIYFRGDFCLGNFTRSGDILEINGRRMAIPTGSTGNYSISRDTVNLILVGKCFRGKPSALLERFHCDTILLGTDLTPSRRQAISAACPNHTIIDLRYSKLTHNPTRTR